MTQKVLVCSPPVSRREPLFTNEKPREKRRVGEMAGGTAAECTAICCCCPCAVMNLLVLAVYKVPVGLCKKAILQKKRKRMMKKNDVLLQQRPSDTGNVGTTLEDYLAAETKKEPSAAENVGGVSEYKEFENEMWTHFNVTGFWRSLSRREP